MSESILDICILLDCLFAFHLDISSKKRRHVTCSYER
ncbi:Uncharacterised protein [Serratia marcescens]|nr:hypothetical protein SM14VA4_43560 [Serratia marcescens]CAI1869849.1 Uncharacterised protein [Serratia marcescens]